MISEEDVEVFFRQSSSMNHVYVTWYFQVHNLCDVGIFHTSVGPDVNARKSPEVSPLEFGNRRVFRLNVVSGKEVVEI